MYTKLYDIHFEIGSEQQLYYARNVLGNNAIEFKQFSGNIADALSMCISDMCANGAFQSLNRDPSISHYPMNPPNHLLATTHPGGGGGHSHTHSPAINMTQFFDLHFECGIDSGKGVHHVKSTFVVQTIAGGLLVYNSSSKFLDDALNDVICDMEGDAFFDDLLKRPTMSQYPMPGGTGTSSASPSSGSISSSSAPAKAKDDVVRKRPSDIGRDAIHPACQDICIAYDHFLDKKCRSFCEWRF